MGDFDALFGGDEPKKKRGGDFDALFGDAPKGKTQAAPFPWETDTEGLTTADKRPFSPTAQAYDANVQALADAPRGPTDVIGNLKLAGQTVAGGAKAIGKIAAHPTTLADPRVRRELERGLSDTITLGLAEKAARAVDPDAFGPETAAADAEASPGTRAGGALVGGFVPSPARFVAGKVGAMVPGRGLIPGAARSIAQYEATAPVAAAINAEPGQAGQAAYQAATDPTGLILSGGMGAVGGVIGRAPERVKERGLQAVARGEAGGTARKALADKATAVAGEGGENLYREIGNDIRLEAGQSILAKSNPGLVAKQYTRRLDQLTPKTDPFYQAIDNAPDPRFANAAKAPKNGGVDLGRVEERLQGSMDKALAEGHAVMADAYDKALARLRGQYGTDGKIIAGEKLASRSMRNYANTLGENLLPESMDPKSRTLAQQAKRAIYRDVVGAIEDEGDRVGVDTTELRKLNRKIHTFATTRDALEDRAMRAAQGHTTLGNLAMGTALIGGGGAAGGLEGLAAGAALEGARRTALPLARGADFALAKLVQASRKGSKPAQLGQMALQLGLSQEIADRISKGGLPGLPKPAEEDEETP